MEEPYPHSPISPFEGAPENLEAYPKNGTVWLIQEPTVPRHNQKVRDLTPLMWWGKHFRVLMERTQTASYNSPAALLQIRTRLKDFNPETDYIAAAGGDSLAVILTGAVLREQGHTYFRYLRFERTRLPDGGRDPASGGYVPVHVALTREGNKPSIRNVK